MGSATARSTNAGSGAPQPAVGFCLAVRIVEWITYCALSTVIRPCRYRPSSFDTAVAVLQNNLGAARWPVPATLQAHLSEAMAHAVPKDVSGLDEWEARNRQRMRPKGAAHTGSEAAADAATVGPVSEVVAPKRKRQPPKAQADAASENSAARKHAPQSQRDAISSAEGALAPERRRARKRAKKLATSTSIDPTAVRAPTPPVMNGVSVARLAQDRAAPTSRFNMMSTLKLDSDSD